MNPDSDNTNNDRLARKLSELGERLNHATYPGPAWRAPHKRHHPWLRRIVAGTLAAAAMLLIVWNVWMSNDEPVVLQPRDTWNRIPRFQAKIPKAIDGRLTSKVSRSFPSLGKVQLPNPTGAFRTSDVPKPQYETFTIPTVSIPTPTERKTNHDSQNHSDIDPGDGRHRLADLGRYRRTARRRTIGTRT